MNAVGIGARVAARRSELGHSQSELARRAGVKAQSIQQLEKGEVKRPRYLLELARALDVSPEWLSYGGRAPSLPPAVAARPGLSDVHFPEQPPELPPLQTMSRDIPVRGTAAANRIGEFQVGESPIDHVRRPPGISGARDVYAIYVVGESMEPRFFEGDLVYVHPHRPAQIGSFVVVQIAEDHGEMRAMIKRLVKRTDSMLVLAQYNPVRTIEVERARGTMHLILSNNELFGV